MITVKIENDYSDGHTSTREVTIASPNPGEDIDEWFEDVVYEHTGDGHGIGTDLGSCYTATVVRSTDSTLVGRTFEWLD